MGEGNFWAQVLRDGKVTIPATLRRKLRIQKGDWVLFEILEVEKAEKGEEVKE